MAETTSKTDAKAAAPEEDKIPRERLIAEARAFTGYDPHEVAGALAGERRKEFTASEAKTLTGKWLKAPVQIDQAEEV